MNYISNVEKLKLKSLYLSNIPVEEIANMFQVTISCVRGRLHRYGIRKTKKHEDYSPLTDRQMEIIDGSLMGDGSLHCNDYTEPYECICGSGSYNAKLDNEDVKKIVSLKNEFSQREIAKLMKVNQSTISRILNGKRWNRVRF